MEATQTTVSSRIQLLDILRGFALLLIVIIHYVEHFDFFAPAQLSLLFSGQTDQQVMDWVFALISGKAYSIFALLFGYSFYIQVKRKELAGQDFRARYLWRLCILFAIGFLHSLIYKGDILHIYAALGIILIALYRVNSAVLIGLSVLLALQLPSIYQLILSVVDPAYSYEETFGMGIWHIVDQTYASGSFGDVLAFNLWEGRTTVWGWTFYNGRYLQLISLFILGLVLARYQWFEKIAQYKKHLPTAMLICAALMVGIRSLLTSSWLAELSPVSSKHLNVILGSHYNLAFTGLIVVVMIFLHLQFSQNRLNQLFAAYGKMSLTNYLSQAVFGVVFFYGFGLGMYQYLGATLSLLLGVLVFTAQACFSLWWQQRYYYGPVEWFWRSLTYTDFSTKMKKYQVKQA